MANKILQHTILGCALAAVAATGMVSSCKKIPEGYISEQIRYVNDTFRVLRGTNWSSDPKAFELDGSNYPISVKLTEIRDLATGKATDVFSQKNKVYVWTALFDPSSDTTVALLNKKREILEIPALQLMEKSGQLMFNEGTGNIPAGNYAFDVSVTNQSGTKTFRDISVIQLLDQAYRQEGAPGCAYFIDGTNTNGDMGSPVMSVKKLSDEGYQVRIKITDKNGKAFNPKAGELIKRGDRPLFESYAKFHPVEYTDTTMVCNYEVTPFPLKQYPGYGYLMYYRIPSQFVTLDPGVAPTDEQIYNVNPRWTFRILVKGTFEVTFKLPKCSRKA
ncbi:DUF5007 domain-containing protein [Chitinophaga rhizosphaerae]|uniref:DUF5007 domain-containing protein n=1 Tax=Chitinophaga rhizosphaerae TaxID=1864947 RepID=UPI000F7FBE0E|nr:DUF5007 domain-containing protein [Chitinophaga rhizosphaerae]